MRMTSDRPAGHAQIQDRHLNFGCNQSWECLIVVHSPSHRVGVPTKNIGRLDADVRLLEWASLPSSEKFRSVENSLLTK